MSGEWAFLDHFVSIISVKTSIRALVGITCNLTVMASDIRFYNSPFLKAVLKAMNINS